jgi:hypothetical protein
VVGLFGPRFDGHPILLKNKHLGLRASQPARGFLCSKLYDLIIVKFYCAHTALLQAEIRSLYSLYLPYKRNFIYSFKCSNHFSVDLFLE